MINEHNDAKQTDVLVAASLAHEIRNPLALIKANLQFVELSDNKSKYKKNYEIIHREIDRINDILRCYLEVGAPGRVILGRFKIYMLINEVSRIFEKPLAAAGITLDISDLDKGIEINADYDKIKQVLINVIQNAKESIEQKKGKKNGLIEIRTVRNGLFADIIVSDNGVGISESDIQMAGTPFFTKKENGCGLGVSISREIIELHSGRLTLSGTENSGARVTITIPLLEVEV